MIDGVKRLREINQEASDIFVFLKHNRYDVGYIYKGGCDATGWFETVLIK